VYVPPRRREEPGHLIFNRGETLVAQAVDDSTFTPAGEPMQIADRIAETAAGVLAPGNFSASSTALAYLAGDPLHQTQLTWFDRGGKTLGVVPPDAVYNDLSLSPDETRVAVTRRDGPNEDIWIVDLARNVPTRFTFDAAQDWHPVWSPDGRWLAFSSTRVLGGQTNSLFWKSIANVGNEELVWKPNTNERLDDWSPDGKFLLVNRTEGRDDLWVLSVEPAPGGERKEEPFLQSPFTETRGQFYPVKDSDGRYWIAYTSNESGQIEVYVESYPRGVPKVRISTNGGTQPRWRRDGRELFYVSPDQKLMAVDVVRVQGQLQFGPPKPLFQTQMSLGGTLFFRMLRYDVTRDGKRFLINSERDSAAATSSPATVVLNWASMLNR
jgi:WD40-like Beta Propeller Repeat